MIERALEEPVAVEQLLSLEELAELQRAARAGLRRSGGVALRARRSRARRAISPASGLEELAPYVEYGASPRGPINLVLGARALALLRGRRYVLPQDVRELAKDVLRHRLVLSYEALAEGVDADRDARPRARGRPDAAARPRARRTSHERRARPQPRSARPRVPAPAPLPGRAPAQGRT